MEGPRINSNGKGDFVNIEAIANRVAYDYKVEKVFAKRNKNNRQFDPMTIIAILTAIFELWQKFCKKEPEPEVKRRKSAALLAKAGRGDLDKQHVKFCKQEGCSMEEAKAILPAAYYDIAHVADDDELAA